MGADHDHASTFAGHRSKLTAAFVITLVVFLSQLVGSILTGSVALLVDTAHMLTDVMGLFMALTAARLMLRPATDRHTWGLRRAEVLSATLQALILFAVGVYALIEGIRRLFQPAEVPGKMLLVFGCIGLVANVIALIILASDRNINLNMRAAFLEVLNDALGSVAVIVSALCLIWFEWDRADAIAGLVIAGLILPRTISLARSAISVLLEGTPPEIDLDEMRRHLEGTEHVIAVHDLHVTRISSDLPILTAHVRVEDTCFYDGHAPDILRSLQECVREHFPLRIEHSTFQLEPVSFGHSPHPFNHDNPPPKS